MDKYKISAEEFAKVSISRLATHPNTSTAFGESRMSEQDLKKRFDKQGELFRAKFNAFLEIIGATGDGESLAGKILTGISKDHTLKALFEDIISESGRFASYLSVGDMTLMEKLQEIAVHEEEIKRQIEAHEAEIEERLSEASQEADEKYVQKVVKKDGISVYTTSEQEPTLALAKGATVGSVARRYEGGRLRAGDPVEELDAVNLGFANKTYVGKTGNQTIDGGLTVKGNFIVEGNNYKTEVEVLNVKAAVIVANSDGVPLAGLSGYVLRTANGDYGILYDPAEDCVKIGLGVYDGETKTFTFDEGEAQPLATRGVIADGNIPVWDEVKRTFVDGGLSIEMLKTEIEEAIEACVKDTEPQEEAVPSSVPKRGESGELAVGDPVDDGDAVNLGVMNRKTANALIGEKSGGAVVIDDVAPDYKVLSVVSSIEPIQASGTPSPDNVLPISPWTGAKLTRCGKNLLDVANAPVIHTRTNFSNFDYAVTDTGIRFDVTGIETNSWARVGFTLGTIDQFRGKTVTISFNCSTSSTEETAAPVAVVSASDTYSGYKNDDTSKSLAQTRTGIVQFTVGDDVAYKYLTVYFYLSYGGNHEAGDWTEYSNIQVEIGSEATEYESYVGNAVALDFGQEVYGGTIDWSTGVLTVERKLYNITGKENWNISNIQYEWGEAIRYDSSVKMENGSIVINSGVISSHYKYIGTNKAYSLWVAPYEGKLCLRICDAFATVDELKAWLVAQYEAGTPIQVVYNVEPYTIQLTPQQVEALAGTNTVFCDTGESVVTYNRDINQAFAELQQAIISLGGNI